MNFLLPRRRRTFLIALAWPLTLVGQAPVEPGPAEDDAAATELERFIATESALAGSGDLLPTSRPVTSVFGGDAALVDLPRSVTVVTAEMMAQLDLGDFSDLGKIGAGTQQVNFYGVPGMPTLRGAKGSVYFNGMQRAYQRNEMPLSFGSLEALDLVRGPAPGHFGPGLVGGYVNLVPKSPYFDRRRGSVQVTVGTESFHHAQIDLGGPTLLAGRPAAYRLSLTAQLADSYYDRIGNDYVSLYGALKVQLADGLSLFTGGEYFNFRSNENAGWNRVTQRLIDRGDYVIGEPLSIVSTTTGVADRALLYKNPALVVPATVVDAGVTGGSVTSVQREALLNLADATERAQAYSAFTAGELVSITPSTSGYLYTPAYFAAGGPVFTTPIDGSTVLADERDYADSENLFYFADLKRQASADTTFTGRFMLDWIETEKLSSYGYAIQTEQLVLETKALAETRFDFLGGMQVSSGLSARYTDATMRQDFSDEPFSRRDISRDTISANSVIPAGPQRGPDGRNYWSPTAQGGANAHSKLWQLSAFGYAENTWTAWLKTYTSALVAHAPYTTQYPEGVDRVPAADPRRAKQSGERNYYSLSFSPVVTVAPGVNLYATWQYGTALDPLQGGAIVGQGNFSNNRLLEGGVKGATADGRFYGSIAVYQWDQTRYDDRTNNAEPLEGKGAELELAGEIVPGLTLLAAFTAQEVRRLSPLGFRSIPLTEQQIALRAGVLNSPFSGIAPAPGYGPYATPASNPDREYPGSPEQQVKLFATYAFADGWRVSLGGIWSEAYWHNFDRTLRLPTAFVLHGSVGYEAARWSLRLVGENLTDEDYFTGAEPVFGANTLLTKAPEISAKAVFTYHF